jgi:hypothetical protein
MVKPDGILNEYVNRVVLTEDSPVIDLPYPKLVSNHVGVGLKEA